MDNNWLNQSSMIKEKSINYLTHIFQDRILCTKVNMSVHPDEIIFCEKSSTKQIFYPRQKIKLDRLAISTKRDVKYFKKESHFE